MTYKNTFEELNDILLNSDKPSQDIRKLIEEGKFDEEPFAKIKKLANIDQNEKYHPEGHVLNHVFLVVDEASVRKSESKDKRVFMWAALLHDIGKLTTTRIRKNRITSYNHDIEGEKIALEFLDKLTDDIDFKLKVTKLVKYHMQPLFYDKNLPFFNPKEMFSETDCEEVALLSACDRMGRGNISEETIKIEKERISNFYNYCKDQKS